MEMTVNEIKAAYMATGLTPTSGEWLNAEQKRVCGLSVLMVARGKETIDSLSEAHERGALKTVAATSLGLDENYVSGFVNAWDGHGIEPNEHGETYEQGFKFGCEARDAVFCGAGV